MCQAFRPSLVSSATENKITASTQLLLSSFRVLHAECEFARVVPRCAHCVHLSAPAARRVVCIRISTFCTQSASSCVLFSSRVLCSRRACCVLVARVVFTLYSLRRPASAKYSALLCIQVSFCTERTCSGVWFSRRAFFLQIHGQLPTEHTQGVPRLISFTHSWTSVHVHCQRAYVR